MSKKPIIVITLGDISGIGPEVIYKSLLNKALLKKAVFILVGDLDVVKAIAARLKKPLKFNITDRSIKQLRKDIINFVDLDNISRRDYRLGYPNEKTTFASKQYIDEAIQILKLKKADCLVTGPINKKSLRLTSSKFPGHTEYIARKFNRSNFSMMMVSRYFRIVLATTHVPLANVASNIKTEPILRKIKLTNEACKRYFKIKVPKIAFCALNPHAGEDGEFGLEEKKILLPAIKRARKSGISVTKPLPADSLFASALSAGGTSAYKGASTHKGNNYDAVICLYHDQAMIPTRMFGFKDSVNVTLGLPFIRTSPAHGTAYDIANALKADEGSMRSAIELAIKMHRNS